LKGVLAMQEKIYSFSNPMGDILNRKIEMVIDDENAVINHMVLPQGTEVPEHYTNSNVYLIIVNGTMTILLNDKTGVEYLHGHILNIPYHTKMNIQNRNEELLEFFVVKAPNPKNYREKQQN
jgi:quercetin dioxygenase-like cupin family protein